MQVDVINGLLGAGKTTFLLNLLDRKSQSEKVAVLVNEFGEIGIDGDLLGGQGADVVELPNGCICCTLNADLKNQVKTIAETYQPDRLYIEPTGVATIKNLLGILGSLSLEKFIDDLRVFVVIDASMFWELLSQNRGFVETQLEMGDVIVINKCDKIDPAELEKIIEFVKSVNRSALLECTSFGRNVDIDAHLGQISKTPAPASQVLAKIAAKPSQPEAALKKFQQFSTSTAGTFDVAKLRQLFADLKTNNYGDIDRAKGIFYTGDNWVRIDLASHEVDEVVMNKEFAVSKIIVIGTGLQKEALRNNFQNCLV